jgi:hypothetical protein
MSRPRNDAPRNDLHLPSLPNQGELWPPQRQRHARVAALLFFALVVLTGAQTYLAFAHAGPAPAHAARALHHGP